MDPSSECRSATDIEYRVEFSYEEFRGMLTKIGSFSIRKMRIARLVCIALWDVTCLSILLNAFSHSMLDLAQLFYIVLALWKRLSYRRRF